MTDDGLPLNHAAPQHGPRPLPLFIEMLRSETATSPERRAAALAGLARYQAAPRTPRPAPMPEVARDGRVTLRDYGGAGVPVVFVPSLINPPFVLDLSPDASLLRWLVAQGRRVLLVDWGTPTPADRDEDVTAHVMRLRRVLTGLDEPPVLVGYCLGGTIATALAATMPVAGLALIAAPWRFKGFDASARAAIADLWNSARPACEALGVVPMEVLQAGFWKLDPARTIAKFEALASADDGALSGFVTLEDWANAGAPLTLAAGRQMFEDFFASDAPGRGAWQVAGHAVEPSALACPVADFVSDRDRIVPAASSIAIGTRHDVAAGHVGMIVGSRARALLWEPLAHWISGVVGSR
ncbi:alpha/beta fold hydrolase [Sphingomonas donggukensis]|uniref:Alpha/beta fold hydrolase n=1 Tax=Sphingomonas donggukensis TaxID=2949093 RepID=A0ABY4TXR1_9SPHN|nr:alpha/beta fold hydrolase [Sphingomonas donggukensis]URW75934.1 alpha/beta fold hydrolase [Sphingomonas donggukensis]